MVDTYQNLARHMPDNGLQMVMFTHQGAAVWADMARKQTQFAWDDG